MAQSSNALVVTCSSVLGEWTTEGLEKIFMLEQGWNIGTSGKGGRGGSQGGGGKGGSEK